MPQIQISLVDNPPSRKLADIIVVLPAAQVSLNPPDLEYSGTHVLNVPSQTISGIAIWSMPEGPVVTFPSELIFPTPTSSDVFGWNLVPPQPPSIRRVLASLVGDILTAYHDAKRTAASAQ